MISLTFTGKGFLRYQVRMMSAAILDVGRGKKTIQDVKEMLEAKDRSVKRHNAPANGLTLEYVDYFEMVALNENIQIREFLRGDQLCSDAWDIEEIEKRVRDKEFPYAYAVCTRNNQEMKGCFVVEQEKACIYLYDMNDQKYVEEVKNQIISKLKTWNVEHFECVPYDHAKNYLKTEKKD